MAVNTSVENYLETILILSSKDTTVRSIDIANELGFSKPSVSVAMKNLKEKKYIIIDVNGYIKLTASGKTIAEKVYERHTLFSKWLISLGVNEKTAIEDACRIEHVLSDISFEAIKKYVLNNPN